MYLFCTFSKKIKKTFKIHLFVIQCKWHWWGRILRCRNYWWDQILGDYSTHKEASTSYIRRIIHSILGGKWIFLLKESSIWNLYTNEVTISIIQIRYGIKTGYLLLYLRKIEHRDKENQSVLYMLKQGVCLKWLDKFPIFLFVKQELIWLVKHTQNWEGLDK